ncbi:glutathione S-transferase family protein [Sphingomonas jatrophae]|uniref:Glutathione S-transferase n=1 Tax=Sphingomonas jatrophae TaxID=1166337 RepID=A0A1I6L4Q6_9SPHN|nr:glutathione S-transferase family protein [Sphingomonas jatrophae]SFR98461.1 glutathione S-transferase [Sphingomonas jatrophae]
MADTLTFFTNPMSRGRTVRWMLEETGCTYDTVLVDWANKPAELLDINPMGKVPVIRHGTRVVSEVAAICTYLADAFPDAGLAPALTDRAAYYRWLFFVAGPFEAAITDKALGIESTAGKEGFVGYGDMDRTLYMIERAVEGAGYLAGERFSAADLVVAAYLNFYMQFGLIPKRPAFVAYGERMAARPAAVRAAEIDDGLMPKQG